MINRDANNDNGDQDLAEINRIKRLFSSLSIPVVEDYRPRYQRFTLTLAILDLNVFFTMNETASVTRWAGRNDWTTMPTDATKSKTTLACAVTDRAFCLAPADTGSPLPVRQ